MRAVAGALLIVAASVFSGAAILAEATLYAHNRLGNIGGWGHLAAAFLALFGLITLAAGLGDEGRRPSSQ